MAKLFIIRTTMGREDQVMDFISSNAIKMEGVYSVFHPQGMRGYIIIEAEAYEAVRELAYGVPYVRGVLSKETKYEEIEGMIEFKPEDIDINTGDVVRVIAGPFKGEKARITRIDLGKAQVVLELLEAAVPIPITIGLESVKVIDRKGRDANKGAA
tara:strand:- start:128 stop:595 length:468 start_codon:yes stop_codon:yes gene_type:complete